MGGKAFSQLLPTAVFPRMPPIIYQSLKARLIPRVEELYHYVGVPHEAPEKADHGDLDIIVTGSRTGEEVPHETLKQLFGSTHSIPMEGCRTSNFAVPVPSDDFALLHISDNNLHEVYYQVDVHVCEDKEDWDRYIFYHSYGDLGMLFGILARGVGLTITYHGLKLAKTEAPIPDPPFVQLSSSFSEILMFFALSEDEWNSGFTTQQEIFDWFMKSRFFDSGRTVRMFDQKHKAKTERTMFYAFPEYVRSIHGIHRILDVAQIQQQALVHFEKKDEYDTIVREKFVLKQIKELFNGNLVMEWTGLTHWGSVKRVMDEVRAKIGDNWREIMVDMPPNEIRLLTLKVKDEVANLPDVVLR